MWPKRLRTMPAKRPPSEPPTCFGLSQLKRLYAVAGTDHNDL